MPIHRPKLESTKAGLGLPTTTRQLEYLSPTRATLTETWNAMPDGAWHQGGVTIAEPGYTWVSDWEAGRPYVTVRFYDRSRQLVGIYTDIVRPVRIVEGGFEYDDLYLDVWQAAGRRPELLDADELEAAVTAGYLTAADATEARRVAAAVMATLS